MSAQIREGQENLELISGLGMQIEFIGQPDVELAFESLGNERGRNKAQHIEVLSIHKEGDITSANVFVPDGKLGKVRISRSFLPKLTR